MRFVSLARCFITGSSGVDFFSRAESWFRFCFLVVLEALIFSNSVNQPVRAACSSLVKPATNSCNLVYDQLFLISVLSNDIFTT